MQIGPWKLNTTAPNMPHPTNVAELGNSPKGTVDGILYRTARSSGMFPDPLSYPTSDFIPQGSLVGVTLKSLYANNWEIAAMTPPPETDVSLKVHQALSYPPRAEHIAFILPRFQKVAPSPEGTRFDMYGLMPMRSVATIDAPGSHLLFGGIEFVTNQIHLGSWAMGDHPVIAFEVATEILLKSGEIIPKESHVIVSSDGVLAQVRDKDQHSLIENDI